MHMLHLFLYWSLKHNRNPHLVFGGPFIKTQILKDPLEMDQPRFIPPPPCHKKIKPPEACLLMSWGRPKPLTRKSPFSYPKREPA